MKNKILPIFILITLSTLCSLNAEIIDKIDEQTKEVKKMQEEQQKLKEIENKNQEFQSRISKLSKEQKCPLLVLSKIINYEANDIPIATISFHNNSNKIIDGFLVSIYCYNLFDEPVRHLGVGTNIFRGIMQKKDIHPNKNWIFSWNLRQFEMTTKLNKIIITKIHFKDGTLWINPYVKNRIDAIKKMLK